MTRLRRFLWSLRGFRIHDIPFSRANIRAAWIQSDPEWLGNLPASDEEWELFERAMNDEGTAR